MTHPTDAQLQAWLDGEPDVALLGDATGAHVEQCARCQELLEGGARLGDALRVWADDSAPAPADDLAARIFRAAETDRAKAEGTKGAAVVPLASRRRSFRWALGPVSLAAAAAMVFALAHRAPTHTPPAATVAVAPGEPGAREATGPNAFAARDPGGSEVLSVDAEGAHTTYSVMEIPGARDGTTTAVVWIQDDDDNGSNAVQ